MEHKYANSIECKFSLDTDVDTFARRITYLTGLIHLHHFDTDDGFIRLQSADIAYSDQLDRPHVVYIAGRYYTLKEGAQVAEDPSNLVSMIRFALSPLPTKPQRIEVIATCSEPAVESCLKYLLKDIWENSEEARDGIEQCWPEVYEDRKATIAQLAAEIKTTLGELRKEIGRPTAGDGTGHRSPTLAKGTTGRKHKQRGANSGTYERVALVLLLIEKQKITKHLAYDWAGITNKTVDRWKENPKTLEMLEDLSKKWPNRLNTIEAHERLEELKRELGI